MDDNLNLLVTLMGPCPECANGVLQAVSDGELTNFLCSSCGHCWHAELGWTHRIDPATCPGCDSKQVCLTAAGSYGQPISHSG